MLTMINRREDRKTCSLPEPMYAVDFVSVCQSSAFRRLGVQGLCYYGLASILPQTMALQYDRDAATSKLNKQRCNNETCKLA